MAQAIPVPQEVEAAGVSDKEFLSKEYIEILERSLLPGAFYEDCRDHLMVCMPVGSLDSRSGETKS